MCYIASHLKFQKVESKSLVWQDSLPSVFSTLRYLTFKSYSPNTHHLPKVLFLPQLQQS